MLLLLAGKRVRKLSADRLDKQGITIEAEPQAAAVSDIHAPLAESGSFSETEQKPALLLHSCCGPCSTAVIERLADEFEITVFYYNPNIYPESEYRKRVEEQQRLIGELPVRYPVHFVEGPYDTARFYEMAKGLEEVHEGGERCFKCYELRMEEAARLAAAGGYDYFTTTLSISPLKNAAKINEIGTRLAEKYGVAHLPSDFKKRNGYKRSIELSAEYDLYRQDYCGCIFSLRERRLQQEKNNSGFSDGNVV